MCVCVKIHARELKMIAAAYLMQFYASKFCCCFRNASTGFMHLHENFEYDFYLFLNIYFFPSINRECLKKEKKRMKVSA